VDCWGGDGVGQLGNGASYTAGGSAVPVEVKGVGGSGTLGGVASVTDDGDGAGYCALLTSGKVDCWGDGNSGQLGDGTFYSSGSSVPVAVKGVGGTGTLGGVVSLTSTSGYCAVLISGTVDCWGGDASGQLGNGTDYTNSAVPVAVKGVGNSGTLTDVTSLVSLSGGGEVYGAGYCALLAPDTVDCWGFDYNGQLGNGAFTSTEVVPVPVIS
jgi:alpha-tubulin suppressor-like RCC1 family protein